MIWRASAANGMRTRSNAFIIDGQDSYGPSTGGLTQSLNNPDIVSEVRIITNQFAPEYGRAAGSVVNVITKSGTNTFHGSAFWFHNNNHLNTLSNTDKSAGFKSAPYRVENQFGGSFGGGPAVTDFYSPGATLRLRRGFLCFHLCPSFFLSSRSQPTSSG